MELPGGGLVGVLRQDLVQKLPHHLHHLAGGGQGPQERFLHLGHTHIEVSEVLIHLNPADDQGCNHRACRGPRKAMSCVQHPRGQVPQSIHGPSLVEGQEAAAGEGDGMRGVWVPLEHLFFHLLSLGPPVVGSSHPSASARPAGAGAGLLLELAVKLPCQPGAWNVAVSSRSAGAPTAG